MEEFSNTFAGLFLPVFMGEFSARLRPLSEHNAIEIVIFTANYLQIDSLLHL